MWQEKLEDCKIQEMFFRCCIFCVESLLNQRIRQNPLIWAEQNQTGADESKGSILFQGPRVWSFLLLNRFKEVLVSFSSRTWDRTNRHGNHRSLIEDERPEPTVELKVTARASWASRTSSEPWVDLLQAKGAQTRNHKAENRTEHLQMF